MSKDYQSATFAAGCFWGVEARFRDQTGVVDAEVGYTGGHKPDPTYHEVCTDTTGHAEAVHVTYDPARISYEDLLALFFAMHNPTTPNRQGPDIGSQYRSVVFFHNEDQKKAAQNYMQQLEASNTYSAPIVTELVPAVVFYRAEEYHQRYFDKTGRSPACHLT